MSNFLLKVRRVFCNHHFIPSKYQRLNLEPGVLSFKCTKCGLYKDIGYQKQDENENGV